MKSELHFPCSKKTSHIYHASKSIPHLLLFTILLLLAAFLVLSQQKSLHLTPPSPASIDLSNSPVAFPNPPSEISQALERPGAGIHSTQRHLVPIGLGAYAFVLTGAYRTGIQSFAIVGLASKPFHVFSKPSFACQWIPNSNTSDSTSDATSDYTSSRSSFARVKKLLPDWNYGRVYTVVVLHCTFQTPVGDDLAGGRLILHVGSIDPENHPFSKVTALVEKAEDFDSNQFSPPYKYDYLYCGSSLYGDVNPERMREWMAYHAMLFGPRSHFVFHDAGGINSEEMKRVLEPWVKLGYVTIQDFKEQEKYDGYYYNQFLVVNDCLFRYKFAANWTFFFDVDEYLYIPKPGTLESVLEEFGRNYSQIMFEQNLMSHNICVKAEPNVSTSSQWGFEKLVFKNVKTSVRLDRKYVLRAALADSAGVHLSEHVSGKNLYSHGKMYYYHFHNTITEHGDSCKEFLERLELNTTKIWVDRIPYVFDDSLSSLAAAAKKYELQQVGDLSSATFKHDNSF